MRALTHLRQRALALLSAIPPALVIALLVAGCGKGKGGGWG